MTLYYDAPGIQIFHGNCEDVFAADALPDIRTVISDPPYYGQAYAQAVALGFRPFNELEEAQWLAHLEAFYLSWVPKLQQVIEYTAGRAWFFTGPNHLPAFARVAYLLGWNLRHLDYVGESEALLQFGRPVPEWDRARISAAFQRSAHPARTESFVLDAILDTPSDGIVLDPFMGSGSTLLAARRIGRPCIGIEANQDLCDEAIARLEAQGR